MGPEDSERRSEAILKAVLDAAHRFLAGGPWRDNVPGVLQALGEAAQVSRVYVTENATTDDDKLVMRGRYEWDAPYVTRTLDDPSTATWPYAKGYTEMAKVLAQGQTAIAIVAELPEYLQKHFSRRDIKSMALVPIMVGDDWWGNIGFHDCADERVWVDVELDALRAAAHTIGAALLRDRTDEELRATTSRYDNLVENVAAIIYIDTVDENATTTYISPRIESVLGYTASEWIRNSESWYNALHPDDRERAWGEYFAGREKGGSWWLEYRLIAKDGAVVWIQEEATMITDADGHPALVQGVMHDVTERRQAAERLLESDAKYRAIIEKIPAITYLDPVNEESLSMYVSPQVESILGCSPELWLSDGAWWHNHVHPEDEPRVWATYVAHRESGEALSQEYRMVRDDGNVVWIREEATLLRDEDGKPWAIQGLMHDVTDTREMQQQVAFLGGHDSLTNLANRATFEQEAVAAIDRAGPRGHAVAVLVLNLDGFHQINEEFGHFVGDKLLKEVATRITRAVRDNDTVSRESGDEFLVLLADLEKDGAGGEDAGGDGEDRRQPGRVDRGVGKLADRIETLMRSPAVIQGHIINPSVSIGISVFPDEGRDPATLIKNADAAMHRAKLIRREELAGTSSEELAGTSSES